MHEIKPKKHWPFLSVYNFAVYNSDAEATAFPIASNPRTSKVILHKFYVLKKRCKGKTCVYIISGIF